jgi:hypothetical protein
MKNLIAVIAAGLLFITIGSANGQAQGPNKEVKNSKTETKAERKELRRLNGSNVSELAKTNFISQFGNLPNVEWKRVDTFDEAIFTKNGIKTTAWYDFDANLVGTTNYTSFTNIPAAGQKGIKDRFKDYVVGSVLFFDDNEANKTDMMLYGVQFDDADNYFVELTKDKNVIVAKVTPQGAVSIFQKL